MNGRPALQGGSGCSHPQVISRTQEAPLSSFTLLTPCLLVPGFLNDRVYSPEIKLAYLPKVTTIFTFFFFHLLDFFLLFLHYSLLRYMKFLSAPAPCCCNLRMEGRERNAGGRGVRRTEGLFVLTFLIMQNSQ